MLGADTQTFLEIHSQLVHIGYGLCWILGGKRGMRYSAVGPRVPTDLPEELLAWGVDERHVPFGVIVA